jgi:small subunit ribosomal protein S1
VAKTKSKKTTIKTSKKASASGAKNKKVNASKVILKEQGMLKQVQHDTKETPANKSTKDLSKIQTMEELLAAVGDTFHGYKRGQEVKGKVVEKTKKALYLDLGGKTEGMVIDRELKAAKSFVDGLKPGDDVVAIVTQPENDKGQMLLSLKHAADNYVWQEFEEKLSSGENMFVHGREINKGGLIVEAKGLQGFIPASQISSNFLGKIEKLVNKQVEVKVIEVDREKNRLIFSEKEVTEADLIKEQRQAIRNIKVGDNLDGEVVGIMPFGLFVRAGDPPMEGLVHISEISWEKVDDPGKFFKQGDKVKVKVLAVDEVLGKLNLSAKQLMPDPWKEIATKYPVETQINGEVVRTAPFGAFVKLEPGIEGLIHISKFPSGKEFKIGDKVNCFVESVNLDDRKMSLGIVLTQKPVGYK